MRTRAGWLMKLLPGVKRQEGFVRMGKRGSSRQGQNFTVVKF